MKGKKYFTVNYETVRNIFQGALFFVVVSMIITKKFRTIVNFKMMEFLKLMGLNSNIDVTVFFFFGLVIVYAVWLICRAAVDIFYWLVFKNSKWYKQLTQWTVKVDITRELKEKIEQKKLFLTKFDEKNISFDHGKFKKWATELIEKEAVKVK